MKTLIFLVLISLGLSVNAQLKVLSTGQVGIGILSSATPLAPLHVGGSVYLPALGSYFINSTTDNGIRLRLHNNGVASYIDFYPSASFRTSNSSNGVNSTPLFLTYNSVGINNTSPSCQLDVTGTIKMNGQVVSSDQRLKDNIQDITTSISSLSQLRGVTYTLKPLNTSSIIANTLTKTDSVTTASVPKLSVIDSAFFSRRHIGFLAQEVKNVYPDLVYADKNGILSVDYISLIPVLVESIKEQQLIINDMKATITELKGKIGSK